MSKTMKEIYTYPKKTLVRDIEVPVNSKNRKVSVFKHCQTSDPQPTCSKWITKNFVPLIDLTQEDKYNKPELNTCLSYAKKIEDIKKTQAKKIENINDLTPRSKEVFRDEITKKLNFPIDKSIYHHLIPLTVNDNESMPVYKKKVNIKKKYFVPGKQHRDVEPDLEDFLTPIEPFKIVLPLFNEPEVYEKPKTSGNLKLVQDLYEKFGPDLL